MKLGILGGAFNPPHKAHRAMAEAARDHLELDRVLLVPSGRPSYSRKRAEDLVPASIRLEMTRALVKDAERLEVSEAEIRRKGPSYTIETVEEIHPGAEIFVIIGSDWVSQLHTWHRIDDLVKRVTFAVIKRPNYGVESPKGFEEGKDPRLVEIPFEPKRTSSSLIRGRVQRGESVRSLVGDRVAAIIERERLYR